jgi:hypothetical protein
VTTRAHYHLRGIDIDTGDPDHLPLHTRLAVLPGHGALSATARKPADPVTSRQLTLLAILRGREYAADEIGRRRWFEWVGNTIGRAVVTNKALSKIEASQLIDALLGSDDPDRDGVQRQNERRSHAQ